MTDNPLQKLYRSKSFYTKLPSGGSHYPSGIKLSVDGEIGIMPMTIKDEIILKSPDVLFNGEALYSLFRSCVPDIENPAEIPQCDVDTLLVGIRLAAGRDQLEINSTCPHCKKSADYEISLGAMLNTAHEISPDNVVVLNKDLKVFVRPYSLESQVKMKIQSFHQAKMQRALNASDSSQPDRDESYRKALADASQIQVDLITDNVLSVESGEDNVQDKTHIAEWVNNIDSYTYKKIIGKITELSKSGMTDKFTLNCASCSENYETEVDINPVNFF
jgi:ribosomal protein L33